MSEFMKMVSIEWTRLSQEEKKRYDRCVEKDRQRYDNEYHEYQRNLLLGDSSEVIVFGDNYGKEEPDEFDQEDRDYKAPENLKESHLP